MSVYDKIGYWSELKLEIIKEYAKAYSIILTSQESKGLSHIYIDAFAGSGVHESKTTGQFVPGSPMNALYVEPPFKEYHFIDLDDQKVKSLREIAGQRDNVFIHNEDCNDILLSKIFPTVQWKDKRRALCLLDPYGLHLDWEVVYTAGQMRSIEIFLNFPIMDMNMNILRRSRSDMVDAEQINRMNKYWGGEVWREIAYQTQETLFGANEEKVTNERLAEGYRQRLMTVAGFEFVPKPLPMKNSSGSIVYYLFFASPNRVGKKIVESIFKKYQSRGF